MNAESETDGGGKDPSVFEKNIGRLLSEAYRPEYPTDAFVERATDRMLGRAKGEAASRSRGRLPHWCSRMRWPTLVSPLVAGLMVLAVGLMGGFFVRLQLPDGATNQPGLAAMIDDANVAVATLASAVDAVWAAPLEENARLGPGFVRLDEGMAQIEFAKGAVVSLEGPVELELINDNRCRLVRGSLAADVPPDANGFTVATADMQIIDLGTAFGVRIDRDGFTEVHVFDGEVDLVENARPDLQPSRLLENQALKLVSKGERVDIKADPMSFIKNTDVDRRLDELREQARLRWIEYSKKWTNDSSVVVRYDFETTSAEAILNTTDPARHPAIPANASPRWIQGRWPGKQAMVFDGRTDLLTIAHDDELRLTKDFSLAVWLRLSGLPYNGWTRIVGKGVGTRRNYGLWMHANDRMVWQICRDGDFEWQDTEVPTRQIEKGKWHLLVGVLADDMSKIYVDGKLETARTMDRPVATNEDPLTIGHYGKVPAHEGYFSGELCELVLLNRALSAKEVAEMYVAGRPD